ncbi:MAG: YdiU family protein [Pseudomonadota bacterium]
MNSSYSLPDQFRPSRAYETLGDETGAPFYDPVKAATFPQTIIRYRNDRWADAAGLGNLSDDEWIAYFGRFEPLPGSLERPLAVRYHGHQFRGYNPDIGDGRGFLFAQLKDDAGRLLDLGTKGSGQTPYSRTGDGRLTLKGGVREILATEMLEALGVYTSKTFSLIETGEELERNDEPSPTRSAVMVRLGHSHVRFGIFQRLQFEGNREAIADLVDYCVAHFDPDLADLDRSEKTVAFFERVIGRSARLCAHWMAAGFVHGVLNTDNMNVTGESFDYGPWRFLPTMDFSFTAAYFDHTGLYAYGRQPDAVAWNLAQLGGTLAVYAEEDALNAALKTYSQYFEAGVEDAFFARLGVMRPATGGFDMIIALMKWMQESGIPFDDFFFDWFGGNASEGRAGASQHNALYASESFQEWKSGFIALEPFQAERLDHAYFQRERPVTMVIDEVETIWAAIADRDDWSLLNAKLKDIAEMRDAHGFDASSFVAVPRKAARREEA